VKENEIYRNNFAGIEIKKGATPLITNNKIYEGKSAGVLIHDNKELGIPKNNRIYKNGAPFSSSSILPSPNSSSSSSSSAIAITANTAASSSIASTSPPSTHAHAGFGLEKNIVVVLNRSERRDSESDLN